MSDGKVEARKFNEYQTDVNKGFEQIKKSIEALKISFGPAIKPDAPSLTGVSSVLGTAGNAGGSSQIELLMQDVRGGMRDVCNELDSISARSTI
jgi:hypothetical protein